MSTEGRLPNLIIVGLGKAGTTSLFWYLSQHSDVCASTVKEPGYFLPAAEGLELPPIGQYASYFKECGRERYRMEASPQYFHGARPVMEEL